MDEEIHHSDEEETQSPSPNKEQSESSHAQKTNKSYSDSSCPETYRSAVGKHEESVALFVDLKSKIKGFHDAAFKVHKGTEAAFSTYEKLLVKSKISSLKQDTFEIKSMMTKIFKAFKESYSQTKGKKAAKKSTKKKFDVANVKKEPVVKDVEMENVQDP
nr:hypothetical protein [Tanacetum cinerariifolium]GFA81095.1 hypothetical protein [Tanacetum cinerariifolium]